MVKELEGAGGGRGSSRTPTIEPDSLLSQDLVEFNLGLCEGPIAGLVHGPHTFYVGETPLIARNGTSNFDSFEIEVFHGDADPSEVKNTLGGTASSTNVGVNLATNTPVTRTTLPGLRNQIDVLEVRLIIQQLYKNHSNGDQREHEAEFAVRYRRAGTTTWRNFTGQPTIKLKGKTTGGYVKEFVKTVPRIPGDWEIQVELISNDSSTTDIVSMAWDSFQMVNKTPRKYPNLAVVRGVGRITDQISSNPQFWGVYATKLVRVPTNFNPLTRHYAGAWDGTFKWAHTDSLVWCLYDLLMNETYGFKKHYPDLKVDRFSAYPIARWCDQLVPRSAGGFQPRFTFNHTFREERNALELIHFMAGIAGITFASDLNGTLRFKCDMPGQVVQIFAPESVKDGIFNYQFTDVAERVNDVTVRFTNPNLGWAPDSRRSVFEDGIQKNGRIPKDFEAVGCIDAFEAERRAHRMILQANTETCMVTFQAPRSAMQLELYDLIGIADPDANWGLTGRILSRTSSQITLRDRLLVPVNTNLNMAVQTPDGIINLVVRSTQAQTTTLTIQSGSLPASTPEFAQFALTSPGSLGLVKPFRVLSITPDTENPELHTITALEHNVNKYGDADNLTTSGIINYSGSLKDNPPVAPVITRVEAGVNQRRVLEDGSFVNRIYVEWRQETNVPIREWRVFFRVVGEDSFQMRVSKEEKIYIRQAELDANYEVQVQAVSWSGKPGAMSAPVQTTTSTSTGVIVPTPMGWTGVAGVNSVTLNPPGTNFQVPAGYRYEVYGAQAGQSFSSALPVVTSSTVPIRIDNVDYSRFFLVAVDRYRNRSGASAPIDVNVIVVATDVPGIPGGLALGTAILPDGRAEVTASWNAVGAAASYQVGVSENGGTEFLTTVPGRNHRVSVLPGTSVSVRVRGVNPFGRFGNWSNLVTIQAARDNVPPATPTGLLIRPGFGSLWLSWTPNSEADLSHYEVFESASTTAPAVGTEASHRANSPTVVLTGLEEAVTRHFWVRAVDTSGNVSPWSARISGTTSSIWQTQTDPVTPTNLTTQTRLAGETAYVSASWSASNNSVSYELGITEEGSNEIIVPVGDLRYEWMALKNTVYSVRVRGINAVGRKSDWTAPLTITSARDTTAPAQVTGLTAGSTLNAVALRWTASAATDLSHYQIFQSTSTTAPSAGSTPTYRVTATVAHIGNLAQDTQYYFWVRAVDTSGNNGPWSARVDARTVTVSKAIQDQMIAGTWATDLGFIRPVTGATLPTTNVGPTISWQNRIYTWNGTAYEPSAKVDDLKFENITGGLRADQIAADLDRLIKDQGQTALADKQAAEAAAAAAEISRTASEAARSASEAARTASETAKGLAETARTAAETARGGAETARDATLGHRDAAETARGAAETARGAAETARGQAESQAQTAAQSANAAGLSATAAAGSADVATSKATDAERSATSAAAQLVSARTGASQTFPVAIGDGSTWTPQTEGHPDSVASVTTAAGVAVMQPNSRILSRATKPWLAGRKFRLAVEGLAPQDPFRELSVIAVGLTSDHRRSAHHQIIKHKLTPLAQAGWQQMRETITLPAAAADVTQLRLGLTLESVLTPLFAGGQLGAWYDPSDLSTLFQDNLGTTPAAIGMPVGMMMDKSGNGFHVRQTDAALRPILMQDAEGRIFLTFDGVDDVMTSANIAGLGAPFFAAAAIQPSSLAGATTARPVFGAYLNASNYAVLHARFSGGNLGIGNAAVRDAGGTAVTVSTLNAFMVDMNPHVLSGGWQDGLVLVRADGVQRPTTAKTTGGVFTGPIRVGQGANAAGAVKLNFFGGVYLMRDAVSVAEIAEIEGLLMARITTEA